ncbi:MAG: thiamine-phosphate kinase [Pseudomonadota bacterium]
MEGSAEQGLIQRHFAPLARSPGALGLRDDAALLTPPPGHEIVLTADAVIAGVHFFPDDAPKDIARKALRVNLSDLAAKGADPLGALLVLSLPDEIGDDWLAAFAAGLDADLETYGIALLGGDTVRAPVLSVSITALGSVPTGAMVRRNGARPGDAIVVTGTIGDAALGLRCRTGELPGDEALIDRYLRPRPRTSLAANLRQYANAAMDVSDGLAGDLDALLGASGQSAAISVYDVPLSDAARAMLDSAPDLLATILTGGDDYEILACVPPGSLPSLATAASALGIPLTRIGTVEEGTGPARFVRTDGSELRLASRAYSHL